MKKIIIKIRKKKIERMQDDRKKNDQKTKIVNIATMVRVRPLLSDEDNFKESINCLDQNCLQIRLSGQIRKQIVQKIFSTQSTQRQVFQSVQPIIQKCISGYNVTIFTYGQTGSGKTHTMFGSDWDNIINKSHQNSSTHHSPQQTFLRSIQQDENHAGLIPRTIHHVFNSLILKRRKYIKVYCSFLQLYNETMLDLLEDDMKQAKQKKMFIHQNQKDGIYIEGLNEMLVQDADQCLELMKKGQKNRTVRQTHMNIKSSRSHTIFQLLIEEIFPATKTYRRMKLNLCDLAGSQKINKAQRMENEHFQELRNINLSLTTLGKVISSLSEKTKPPYRESKLTRLLQDSLGGNTFTAIIATITTKSSCLDESLNTLKFLQRAKQIKTEVISNIHSNDNPQMNKLEKEISYLKDILKMKRNGTTIIDADMNEKLKKLQQENSRLRGLVNEELIEKLKKENMHLKLKLERKNNDELSESILRQENTATIETNLSKVRLQSQQQFRTLDHKTQHSSKHEVTSTKDQVQSQYRVSSHSHNLLKKKSTNGKQFNFGGRSADATTASQNSKKNQNRFPSLGNRITAHSTNKILQRIQQIQKVKLINKIKLQKQLESMNHNSKISLDSKTTFGRGSKYSNKYRY